MLKKKNVVIKHLNDVHPALRGRTGKVHSAMENGKWRIKIDECFGVAILEEHKFEVIEK